MAVPLIPTTTMRLDELPLSKVRRAVDLYLEEAYAGEEPPILPEFLRGDLDGPTSASLDDFLDESDESCGGARRYALRLGNQRYPFMKLRLVEYLFQGEFFFTVDTHDQMFADQSDPELARLKAYNREVRCKIEASWEGAGLPTTAHLKGLTDDSAPVEREASRGVRVLVVDDDPAIQDTVVRMLQFKGFDCDRADDGEEAVELACAERHQLVLMDVEMPRMSGIEACEELKADPLRAALPVLLMTAGAVDLARDATSPDGFLVKPFRADALFRFIDAVLGDERGADEADELEESAT